MADPNWKATSLWNRTQVQKVKVVQKQKPWLEKLSWLFWHKTLRSKKVIHNCQRTQSICGSSKMCEKQENKTQNSEYSYYVTLPYDGSMDVILNSISTAGETWNVHLWGKRSHSPHAYSVFFQCDPQFILRMVISWYATIMITIILLNIIEVIIDDATIVQPQGLFNLSSHVPRACIRHFHWGFSSVWMDFLEYIGATTKLCGGSDWNVSASTEACKIFLKWTSPKLKHIILCIVIMILIEVVSLFGFEIKFLVVFSSSIFQVWLSIV